jgi:hypothetical protein
MILFTVMRSYQIKKMMSLVKYKNKRVEDFKLSIPLSIRPKSLTKLIIIHISVFNIYITIKYKQVGAIELSNFKLKPLYRVNISVFL